MLTGAKRALRDLVSRKSDSIEGCGGWSQGPVATAFRTHHQRHARHGHRRQPLQKRRSLVTSRSASDFGFGQRNASSHGGMSRPSDFFGTGWTSPIRPPDRAPGAPGASAASNWPGCGSFPAPLAQMSQPPSRQLLFCQCRCIMAFSLLEAMIGLAPALHEADNPTLLRALTSQGLLKPEDPQSETAKRSDEFSRDTDATNRGRKKANPDCGR